MLDLSKVNQKDIKMMSHVCRSTFFLIKLQTVARNYLKKRLRCRCEVRLISLSVTLNTLFEMIFYASNLFLLITWHMHFPAALTKRFSAVVICITCRISWEIQNFCWLVSLNNLQLLAQIKYYLNHRANTCSKFNPLVPDAHKKVTHT